MALNHGFEKAIVRDTIIDLVVTCIMIAVCVLLAVYTKNPVAMISSIIVGTIQIIVGIVQTKDLVLAIKNLRKKQKEWQNYGK